MLYVEVHKQKGQLITEWSEMSLSQGISLYKVADKLPPKVKKMYGLLISEQTPEVQKEILELRESITHKEARKKLPQIYGEIIKIMTTLPEVVVDRLTADERSQLYNKCLVRFVIGVLYLPYDYKVRFCEYIEHKGEKWYFPEAREVLGTRKEFDKMTAIEFSDLSDLELAAKELEGGVFERMANIISILCRPKGEKYDEQTCLERAEEVFLDLPMNEVWEVFFYTVERLALSKTYTQLYTVREMLAESKQPQ